MIKISNDRRHGVNAATAYLMRKQSDFDAVACFKDWGFRPAILPSLFGMKLEPVKRQVKNALGKPLPSISL
jgi:hypothetical protein